MNREKKWTQTPWHIAEETIDGAEEVVVKAGEYYIATLHKCVDHDPDSDHNNARLIAQAPRLVEALEGLLDCIDETRGAWAGAAVAEAESVLAAVYGESDERDT